MRRIERTGAFRRDVCVHRCRGRPDSDCDVLLFLFIGGLMRRDISLRIKERVYQAAFVFLVLFAVMVIYNDLLKTIPGLADRLQ